METGYAARWADAVDLNKINCCFVVLRCLHVQLLAVVVVKLFYYNAQLMRHGPPEGDTCAIAASQHYDMLKRNKQRK